MIKATAFYRTNSNVVTNHDTLRPPIKTVAKSVSLNSFGGGDPAVVHHWNVARKSGLEEKSSVIWETSTFSLRSARAGGRADGNSARLASRGKWNILPPPCNKLRGLNVAPFVV
ncbi:hypothetical protein CEXT_388091 [Caerostris extrusa]|uniref:Uncharacterized protein n=1 Tax=Caerostris extrusa TaxID=172846 RepID=A0AAV4RCL5_CAEEX|nr:hypothetical protein CEXT_388091 [Caerostris extrusa]